jgi:hypothetical protein
MYKVPAVDIPLYWIRPQNILSAEKGSHRFLWDMHYTPFNQPPSFPMTAVYENTPPSQSAPWIMPGNYVVKLTVDGKTVAQSFKVRMDPRVKTSLADLQKQHDLSMMCYESGKACRNIVKDIETYRSTLKMQMTNASASVADSLNKKDQAVAALENTPAGKNDLSLVKLNGNFASLQSDMQNADVAPTSATINAVNDAQKQLNDLVKRWNDLKNK